MIKIIIKIFRYPRANKEFYSAVSANLALKLYWKVLSIAKSRTKDLYRNIFVKTLGVTKLLELNQPIYKVEPFILKDSATHEITLQSKIVSSQLKLNSYFENLENYDARNEELKSIYPGLNTDAWHLFPPNIAMLNWLVRNHKKSTGILDVGTGLGNIFGYLSSYFPNERMIGIDDFSQIENKQVQEYQDKLWRIKITNQWPKEYFEVVICAGVPLIELRKRILRLNCNFLLVDTQSLAKNNNFFVIKKKFELIEINEVFAVLQKHN